MALWFPLMVNGEKIGQVEIVRRDDPISPTGEFTYDWVVDANKGMTRCGSNIRSGELRHVYVDGAFELVRKVMDAYLGKKNPAEIIEPWHGKTVCRSDVVGGDNR